jgi:DMSO reductase anchor subunit
LNKKILEIAKPARQITWGRQAVINFFLGGTGAGLFLFSNAIDFFSADPTAVSKKITFVLICPLLVVMGFAALATEVGRPLKAGYLLQKLKHVWLSRETFFALVFVGTTLLYGFLCWIGFRVIALTSATALLVCQGLILYQIRAIDSWNFLAIPPFFFSSGFCSGSGMFLLMESIHPNPPTENSLIIALIGITVNLTLWLVYISRFRVRNFTETWSLSYAMVELVRHTSGHLLSLTFLVLCLVLRRGAMDFIIDILEAITGLVIMGGIWRQEATIILKKSYKKGISISV